MTGYHLTTFTSTLIFSDVVDGTLIRTDLQTEFSGAHFKRLRSMRINGFFEGDCSSVGYAFYEKRFKRKIEFRGNADSPNVGALTAARPQSMVLYGNQNFTLYS